MMTKPIGSSDKSIPDRCITPISFDDEKYVTMEVYRDDRGLPVALQLSKIRAEWPYRVFAGASESFFQTHADARKHCEKRYHPINYSPRR